MEHHGIRLIKVKALVFEAYSKKIHVPLNCPGLKRKHSGFHVVLSKGMS